MQPLLNLIQEYGPPMRLPDRSETESLQAILIEMPPGLEAIVPGYLAARRSTNFRGEDQIDFWSSTMLGTSFFQLTSLSSSDGCCWAEHKLTPRITDAVRRNAFNTYATAAPPNHRER
jgi:hypothetical protein